MDSRVVLGGSTAGMLARELAEAVGTRLGQATIERFPDQELHVAVHEPLAGAEVVLVQSLVAPAAEHLLELSMLADACRRAGAARIVAVVPYLAYARQDRSASAGECLGGPRFAQSLEQAGVEEVVLVDPHAEGTQGWFRVPARQLSAIPLLARALEPVAPEAVVVSPDLGGAKRAGQLASLLSRPLAVVRKTRQSGSTVTTHGVLGDVRGRPVILADDLIATGATLNAAIAALRLAGSAAEVTVVATHPVLSPGSAELLALSGIRRLVCTDSVPRLASLPFPTTVVKLAGLIAGSL